MKRAILAAAAVLFGLASSASAQAPHDPARLFPWEATIELPSTQGLVRLPLPAAVLERTRGDLSDLRVHDEASEARPYLIESGRRVEEATVYAITPREVSRRVERGASLAAHYREHLRVAPPPQAAGGRWRLLVDAPSPRFVRDVVVYEVAGDARREIAQGTVFRFDAPRRERLEVELPPIAEGAQLEVQITGEGGYLEPTVALVVVREPIDPPRLTLPLAELDRARRDGRTVLEVARPSGIVVDRLRVVTGSAWFDREVRVLDLREGEAPREVGRGAIFRIQELAGAERVEIELSRAVGDRLRVEIDDGDSPALEGLRLEADVRQPAVVLASDGAPLTLRFGGGRAQAPRYDVARLLGTRIADRILAASLPEARLGEPRPNPRFDDGPALRFAMRPGRAPDAARYAVAASLTVAGAAEGLSRVRLPASVLAAARDDLADLRVVDDAGAQWPYLRGADAEDPMALTVRPSAEPGGRTAYRLGLPVDRARITRLELATDAPFVSRDFVLYALDAEGHRTELTRGRLSRTPQEASPLAVRAADRRVEALELVVSDGSDAPLVLERVTAFATSPTLYLAAPDGAYRVLAGDPEAGPPRYEIESARALVLSVRAVDAEVGEAAPNPAFRPREPETDVSAWMVWAVLIVAILLLGLLTLRVVRQGGRDEEAPPAPEEGPDGDGDGGGTAGGGSKPLQF